MRNEIITKINDLFDENIDLKVRNEWLETIKKGQESLAIDASESDFYISELDKKLIDFGKKSLKTNVLRSWGTDVAVKRDETTKELIVQSYEKWIGEMIREDSIPENMSKEEVKNSIYKYSLEDYNKEKAKAIKCFEERELKEREKEDE